MSVIQTILNEKKFVSLSALELSLSSSVTSTATGLVDSRLKLSNLIGRDIIFPVDYKTLSQSVYFGSAYLRTKAILGKIIDNYPIGLSGSTTSNLYLEDIERANNFINDLTEYEWWVMRQLCGETLETSNMTFTASATAVRTSLSSTITSSSQTFSIPVVNRDAFNYLKPPQGVSNRVILDDYYSDLLTGDPTLDIDAISGQTPFEQILVTAIAFDYGIQRSLKNWSGTGSENLIYNTYDGIVESEIIPDVIKDRVNRSLTLQKLVPPNLKNDDDQNILERFLESFAQSFDDIKIYVDGLRSLFKNYWANWEKLPKGYVQQLVAHQYGIELFSSENREIRDELMIRGQYKSQKEITFEFWNRILCSLVYILKTKGTVESIKAASRAYGFSTGLIQIYELASYKSFLDGYYNEVQNFSTGKFRRQVNTLRDKAFNSVSANITSVSSDTLMTHMRFQFKDEVLTGSSHSVSGTLYSIPSSTTGKDTSLNYVFSKDNNVSTSGFGFISFVLSSGTASLTTGYSFSERFLKQGFDNTLNIFSGVDHGKLFVAIGFLESNYDFYEPVLTSSTAYFGSLTSTQYVPTSFTVGSNTNPPHGNIDNVLLQRHGYSDTHFRNLTLDTTLLNTSSSYTANVLAWKFNEYRTLTEANKNYIIDSGLSSFTGAPTFIGLTSAIPYEYAYDSPAFINDNIAGFKLQKLQGTQLEQVIDKNIRVGISLASPINNYIHTAYGSNFGELFAHPQDYFVKYDDGHSTYSYSLAETKMTELFSVVGTKRSDINFVEFLKFINRISGHISSFFQFIEQVIPASKRLLEKGLIIENPINGRQILTKTSIVNSGDLLKEKTIEVDDQIVISRDIVSNVDIDATPVASINNRLKISGELTSDIEMSMSYKTFNLSAGIGGQAQIEINSTGEQSKRTKTFEKTIDDSVSSSMEFNRTLSATANIENVEYISGLQRQMLAYFPRVALQHITKTNYTNNPNSFEPKSVFFKYVAPESSSANQYHMIMTEDVEKTLLSTSLTASEDDKRITGTIFITDPSGRKIDTAYNAIRVNTSQATFNDGRNRMRVVIDGDELPFNEHIKEYPIKNKQGIRFEISLSGAPNDGQSNNNETRIYFYNLLNPYEEGYAVALIFADNMEEYSRDVGVSIQRSR